MAFYWNRKNKEKELKIKKKERSNKLKQKAAILEELERQNEDRKNDLIKKMQIMENKREMFQKIKRENLQKLKKLREHRHCSCEAKRKDLLALESEKREEILGIQSVLLNRSLSRDTLYNNKRITANEQTVLSQITLEKNLTLFNKKMNFLKSQSVFKKTQEEKIKLFKEFKRKEAEKRKKELDDTMK